MTDVRGGIDLGGTKIEAVVVDADGKVISQSRHPTPTDGGPAKVADEMAAAIGSAAEQAGVATERLGGIGVGSPGDIDSRRGSVAHARNLPDWDAPFALGPTLEDALSTKVKIGNDVQVAVEGERVLGAGTDYSSFIGVWWGTGIGGGIVLRKALWRGRGAAGEIGHTVVKRGGARCGCGRRGCLEAYAGRASMEAAARRAVKRGQKTDLFEIMEKRSRTRLTSGVWARALDSKDKLAHELIDRAVKMLGTGIASAVNLLDVEAVILGGGLGVRLGPRYLEAITQEMMKHIFVPERPPAMHVAGLGDLGGAIGASLLVANKKH
ncbi:MAG TPA: ROK family protein [Solirubrobacteraceae bacterium]|jgi:glucokinase|nr:ROK family protein [Solirubrobacteraceae bacterium]